MARYRSDNAWKWLSGQHHNKLKFSDLWRLLLIRIADHAHDMVDEEGRRLTGRRPYSYDLAAIAEEIEISLKQTDLIRIASYLEEHQWIRLTRRAPIKAVLTFEGMEAAETILQEIADQNEEKTPYPPASNRFVKLDDNSPKFQDAVLYLEKLIAEAAAVRINTWPEKEGIIESLKSALAMLRTKYVNRAAIVAIVSTSTMFVAKKFAEAPIADLAKRTWDTVKRLFWS